MDVELKIKTYLPSKAGASHDIADIVVSKRTMINRFVVCTYPPSVRSNFFHSLEHPTMGSMPHASVVAEITGNGVSRGIAACLHILVNPEIPCGSVKSWWNFRV